nr:MAG TPA: hypothetical protein [Caudoviricetes sp.]
MVMKPLHPIRPQPEARKQAHLRACTPAQSSYPAKPSEPRTRPHSRLTDDLRSQEPLVTRT